MKNWKINLFVILLVVFMLICGFMLGRINFGNDSEEDNDYVTEDGNIITNDDVNGSYDNAENEEQNENINSNQDSDSNVTVDNKINSSDDFMSLFVGEYNYEKIEESTADCKSFMNLEIKEDGTYIYNHGNNCAGGWTLEGNYSISKDKIYLFNDNCKISNIDGVCEYANCTAIEKLDYKLIDGKVKIYSGTIELLNK